MDKLLWNNGCTKENLTPFSLQSLEPLAARWPLPGVGSVFAQVIWAYCEALQASHGLVCHSTSLVPPYNRHTFY